ncbi:MAG: divalent-cation tolerance protein CutA [Candidatus Anstonellales archaeon]
MKHSIVYITTDSEKEAEKIAKLLLRRRLIACANIFPCKSFFWWNNRIAKQKEFILICKTENSKLSRIREEVKKAHNYEIPCISAIGFYPNKEYGQWLEKQLK